MPDDTTDDGWRAHVDGMATLIRALAVESQRLGQAFAGEQHLHATDMQALIHVMEAEREGEPLTPGQLAGELGLSTGATTSVIDRLESQQHVRRERDGHDRRRIILHVDAAAMAVAAQFFGPLGRRIAEVLAPYSEAELAAAAAVMTTLTAAMQEHRLHLGSAAPGEHEA